jgi:TP901 family phage tail tape measure protein
MAMMKAMELGVRLNVDGSQAAAGMTKTGRAVDGLKGKFGGLNNRIDRMKKAIQGVTMVSAALNLAMGIGSHQAASFESQMSAVQAVLGLSKDQMADLDALAQRMGATTVFSASQAAEGMEFMARAGFTTNEIMGGLEGVMAAAAAEGAGLAETTSIVADTIKGFGLAATDTNNVADILALASAKANTNMAGIGEALKYVSSTARQAGVPLSETVAAIAALQDAGLKGTMAGTALSTMMTKMAAPSNTAKEAMANLGIAFSDAEGNLLPLRQQLIMLQKGFAEAGGSADKLALANELFGVRGQQAALNLVDRLSDTEKPLDDLFTALEQANGSAAQMAETRLDNFTGSMKLLMSAVEGVSIALFTDVNGGFRSAIDGLTSFLSAMSAGMRGEQTDGFAAQFGKGLLEAFQVLGMIGSKVTEVGSMIVGFIDEAFGEGAASKIGIVTGALTLIIAAVAPVLGFAATVGAIVTFLGEALVPVLYVVGVVAAALGIGFGAAASGASTESNAAIDTIVQAFMFLKGVVMGVITTVRNNFDILVEAFRPAVESLQESFGRIIGLFGPATEGGEDMGKTVGDALGMIIVVIGTILGAVAEVVAFMASAYAAIFEVFLGPLIASGAEIRNGLVNLITGATDMKTAFIQIFAGIAGILLSPMKMAVTGVMAMMRGVIESPVGKRLLALLGEDADKMAASLTQGIKDVNAIGTGFGPTPAEQAGGVLRDRTAQQAAIAAPEVNATVVNEDNRKLTVEVPVNLNGRRINAATAQAEIELSERAGFSDVSWQRRQVLERGARLVPAM